MFQRGLGRRNNRISAGRQAPELERAAIKTIKAQTTTDTRRHSIAVAMQISAQIDLGASPGVVGALAGPSASRVPPRGQRLFLSKCRVSCRAFRRNGAILYASWRRWEGSCTHEAERQNVGNAANDVLGVTWVQREEGRSPCCESSVDRVHDQNVNERIRAVRDARLTMER